MPAIDDFFKKVAHPPHPRLRDWTRRLGEPGTSATLEVFQGQGEFGADRPEIYVQFAQNDLPTRVDQVAWDDDLNSGLIRLGVRAMSPKQEAERYSFGLRAALKKAEREFGDGYFNAVLVYLIKDGDLARYPKIADVLKYAYANEPHREGGEFDRFSVCRELIADAIGGRAKELTDDLKYTQEEAKQILVSALALYLDGRFSVSNRRKFGLLD